MRFDEISGVSGCGLMNGVCVVCVFVSGDCYLLLWTFFTSCLQENVLPWSKICLDLSDSYIVAYLDLEANKKIIKKKILSLNYL